MAYLPELSGKPLMSLDIRASSIYLKAGRASTGQQTFTASVIAGSYMARPNTKNQSQDRKAPSTEASRRVTGMCKTGVKKSQLLQANIAQLLWSNMVSNNLEQLYWSNNMARNQEMNLTLFAEKCCHERLPLLSLCCSITTFYRLPLPVGFERYSVCI